MKTCCCDDKYNNVSTSSFFWHWFLCFIKRFLVGVSDYIDIHVVSMQSKVLEDESLLRTKRRRSQILIKKKATIFFKALQNNKKIKRQHKM